jgi:hypothetical protein
MPIDYFKPLDSLKTLPNSEFTRARGGFAGVPGSGSDDLESFGLEDQLKREAELNSVSSQRAGDPRDAKAFSSLAGLYGDRMGSSQIGQQHDLLASRASADEAALQAGFGPEGMDVSNSPSAARGAYQRKLETTKVTAPLEVARTNAQGGVEQQRVANQGALDVAKEKGSQYENFLGMLNNTTGGRGVSHLSAPGGGGVTFDQQRPTPTPLIQGITNARAALEKAKQGAGGISGFMGGNSRLQAAQSVYDQAVQGALAQDPSDPEAKEYALSIAKHPQFSKMGVDDILAAQGHQLLPEQRAELQRLLGLIRGF